MGVLLPVDGQILLNPPKNASIISVNVDLVNVLFTVRDRRGGYVKDLRKEDFEILENGRKQEIRQFARDLDTPLVVSILIDTSGSVAQVLPEEQAAARKFLREVIRQADKALLASFSSHIAVWQDLTSSLPQLNAALDKTADPIDPRKAGEFRARGGTLLFDSVSLVAREKLRKQPGRKAMIILTDGLDNGSIATANSASKDAIESDTVIYGIHYEVDRLQKDNSGLAALRKLTEPTGGRTFHVDDENKLDAIFADIQEEMRSQYAIGFKPADEVRDGSFRKLEVRSRKSRMKVTTRSGYFAVSK